ncbi:MAG: DUF2062 domain-containing protein [Flavobacteriales bacterium]|nr:DUF2062 domain-containing protein [Flavobacteriales bacterium]
MTETADTFFKIESSEKSDVKVCVIIPTYNNERTLARVIDGVLVHTNEVIIVNDGATDSTPEILKSYQSLQQIHFKKNIGKGKALREGFKKAIELGYNYAVTIDSDGQHFPDDIPSFLKEIEISSDPILLIGSRNMEQDGIPKKSSFGNKFSNFWFWFETGIKLEDTQSGYRVYPLDILPKKFFTKKFEFEIESIVRVAWKGVTVKNIPINISYNPEERVTHFRPFKDFTRISILNTVLVVIALLYIKPRDLFKNFKKKSLKRFIQEDLIGSGDSNLKISLSLALGVFIGIAPLWGVQTLLAISLAVFLNLNKLITFIGSNISIPPMIPFIIYGSLQIGALFVSSKTFTFSQNKSTFETIAEHFTQYIVGSILLALISSIVLGLVCYITLLITRKKSV